MGTFHVTSTVLADLHTSSASETVDEEEQYETVVKIFMFYFIIAFNNYVYLF